MLALPLTGSTPELYHGKYVAGGFASGEQGVWYEPSLSNGTLFQDAAGTTPVTAVEQPVGLMLDKSKGLVLGAELVLRTNSPSAWTSPTTPRPVLEDGQIKIDFGGNSLAAYSYLRVPNLSQNLKVGVIYRVSGKARVSPGGSVNINVYSGGSFGGGSATITSTELVSFSYLVTPQTNDIYIFANNMGQGETIWLADISVRELPGNHARQTTSADRPVFSARYNLLTKTEDFSGWQIARSSVTTSDVLSPDKINYAKVIVNNINVGSGFPPYIVFSGSGMSPLNTYKTSCCMKKGLAKYGHLRFDSTGGTVTGVSAYFDLEAGTFAGYLAITNATPISATIIDIGDGWYECTATFALGAGGAGFRSWVGMSNVYGDYYADVGTLSIYVWGASLVPANQAHLPYQRVNTATDYDADPVKFPPYLRFNGVNSWMVTPSINFTATDKMTVFAGVRKLSDVASIFMETSSNLNANVGTVAVVIGIDTNGNGYHSPSRGTAESKNTLNASAITFAAPDSAAITATHDIAGNLSKIRRNTISGAITGVGVKGSGNFGNYPLYIGRRGGTSLSFNGWLHSLIIRGAATDDAHLTHTEKYIAYKTGITL